MLLCLAGWDVLEHGCFYIFMGINLEMALHIQLRTVQKLQTSPINPFHKIQYIFFLTINAENMHYNNTASKTGVIK